MSDTEVPWRSDASLEDVLSIIELWINRNDLSHADPVELRTFPGSLHWHLRRSGISGTLELTVWPAQRRIWMSRRANRDAPWIGELPDEFFRFMSRS